MVFDEIKVREIETKYKNGERLKRSERIYYQGMFGIRRDDIKYYMNSYELNEYVISKTDINYFIEKYMGIFLNDAQKKVMESYHENRFNIYMASRHIGIENIFIYTTLHTLLFNNKTILFIDNDADSAYEKINTLKTYLTKLPFFLKQGVNTLNKSAIKFENGSSLFVSSSKPIIMSRYYNEIFLFDMALWSNKKANDIYSLSIPSISSDHNNKLTIISPPNGHNKFYELFRNAELPEDDPGKTQFYATRVYWWEILGNDIQWKSNMLMDYGQEYFNKYIDMKFYSKE